MRQIKSKHTQPEMAVRRLVHGLGYRFRLHPKDLPGKPDLVFRRKKKAIFVHGCFWHGHDSEACADSRTPKSNTAYWTAKLARNRARDAEHVAALKREGWSVLTIWECDILDPDKLTRRVSGFLE